MDIFGPVPLPLVIGLLFAGLAIVFLLCVPSAWVFPLLRMFGWRVKEPPKRRE